MEQKDGRAERSLPHRHRQHHRSVLPPNSKRHVGNTTSLSASRPSVPHLRALDKAMHKDMAAHEAYDQRAPGAPDPAEPGRERQRSARKTNAQNLVSARERVSNQRQRPPEERPECSA